MAEPALVDTNIVSYVFRADSRAELYREVIEDARLFISFMTLAELHRWELERNWGSRQRQRLSLFLDQFTLLMCDRELCRGWGVVKDSARRTGRPIDTADAWIAATALHYELPLITHNPADYAGVAGLVVVTRAPRR